MRLTLRRAAFLGVLVLSGCPTTGMNDTDVVTSVDTQLPPTDTVSSGQDAGNDVNTTGLDVPANTLDVVNAQDVQGRSDVQSNLDTGPDRDVQTAVDAAVATDAVTQDSTSTTPRWTLHTHPCDGINRTDALHRDDDGTLYLGCGTGAVGTGLWRSTTEGRTWTQVAGMPNAVLSVFRVSSIERGPDGALYLGGYDADTKVMGLRLDTAVDPIVVSRVLVGGTVFGSNFHTAFLRLRSDGSALADDLNGHSALFRTDATIGTSGWQDANMWESDGSSHQILDLITFGNRYYAAGSTISENPFVMLPDQNAGAAPYRMTPVRLSTAWIGELWGVAANARRVVAVGVDQASDTGKIFVSGADPYRAVDYTETNLHTAAGLTGKTWARGVCMRADRVVVVGERQPLSSTTGLVVQSTDGGASWENITPAGVSDSVSKCLIADDGTLWVAGAKGLVGSYH